MSYTATSAAKNRFETKDKPNGVRGASMVMVLSLLHKTRVTHF